MSTYQQLPIINRLNPILKLNLETIKTKFCLYEFRIYVQKKPKDQQNITEFSGTNNT